MPIVVRYLNDSTQECTIRPTPFVSISTNMDKTGAGDSIGTSYSITLTGTLLPGKGFPYARDVNDNLFQGWEATPSIDGDGDGIPEQFAKENITMGAPAGPEESFDATVGHSNKNEPRHQYIPWNYRLDAIFFKQRVLRSLFALDGQRLEISPVHNDEPAIICYPRLESISFDEGLYFEKCDYTINLVADTLLDKNLNVHDDGNPLYLQHTASGSPPVPHGKEIISLAGVGKDRKKTGYGAETSIIDAKGAFVSSVNESWSIEANEGGEGTLADGTPIPRTYRISHTMSATGKPHYYPVDGGTKVAKKEAWESARDYVQKKLLPPDSGVTSYPNIFGQLGSGSINLIAEYGGYNHVRTEEVGQTDGTYNLTENWVLSTGTAHESYSMSVSSATDTPFVSISIDGNIKGLSSMKASGLMYGGIGGRPQSNPLLSGVPGSGAYSNAITHYHKISNNGSFGIGSDIYKRANRQVAVQLNSQPKSVSLGLNEFNGEITYNLAFDNRPTNIISGVLSENISINDTYPGDVMAVIPVIGRETGPVLQYIGGRTEYKRDLNLELVMDYTDVPYGPKRNSLLLLKPSIVEPTRTQLRELIKELSPEKEPGVRKWFISPPTESWVPKEGRYSFNISWVYEMDK